ncbi:MAG: hypothetical protein AB4368_26740 [Xenococcaceae cyanobacterium]
MTTFNQRIYTPTINLFAFQQQQEFFAKGSPQLLCPEWVTNKYSQILNNFYVCQKIKPLSETETNSVINQEKSNFSTSDRPQEFWGTIKTKDHLELIHGEAYPSWIDTNCLISLRLNKQKEIKTKAVSVENLAYYNPKNCFSPERVNTNLGQTVVITALIGNKKNKRKESLQSLANGCVFSFANLLNSSQKVVCIHSSIVANGFISTYYLPGASGNYNQIMVCLFFKEADRANFQKQREQLTQFLLSLHKLTYVHQHSKNLLKLACYQLNRLQDYLDIPNTNNLTETLWQNSIQTQYSSIKDRHQTSNHKRAEKSLLETTKMPVAVAS